MAKTTGKQKSKLSGAGEPPTTSSGLLERLKRSGHPMKSADEVRARIHATLAPMKAEANAPGRASPQFLLRFPDEAMRDRITLLAKANGRSMNAEIIDRLQKSIIDYIPVDEAIAELYDRIEKLEHKVSGLDDQLNVRYDD